jgi:hypothetical protein
VLSIICNTIIMVFSKSDTYNRKYVMKSIKTNINSPKGSDKGNIENKLYYITKNNQSERLYAFKESGLEITDL